MRARYRDEQGVALPMALMSLTLLSTLLLALASLSRTEPLIAASHLRSSQARTLADSGVEYALWALSNPAHPSGLPIPLPTPVGPPFDGSTFLTLGDSGGFTVTVENSADGDPQRRTVRAVGWTPTNSSTDARPKARRMVTVDVVAVPVLGARAPCALCVRGTLTLTGDVTIDGTNRDPACGDDTKYGTLTGDITTVTGSVSRVGGAGAGAQHQAASTFDALTLSPAALDALKTMAWRGGTYYGPGFPRGGTVSDGGATWSGRIGFDASNPLPGGVVFVDTTDGRNVASDPAGLATLASARLEAGAFAAPDGVFRGWIVVNGSLDITAGLRMRGLVYAVDALTYQTTATGRVEGLAVSLNVREGSGSRLEAVDGGELAVQFDCEHADAAGLVPHGFRPIPGTYREERD
jgi:hypothetical protein